MTLTGDKILANARDLVPQICTQSDAIATGRRLPDGLVADLRSAGVFRMPMPREWGGPETTPRQQTEVVEVLSEADPSVGWCVMIGSDAGFYSAFLDDEVGHDLFLISTPSRPVGSFLRVGPRCATAGSVSVVDGRSVVVHFMRR